MVTKWFNIKSKSGCGDYQTDHGAYEGESQTPSFVVLLAGRDFSPLILKFHYNSIS